MNKQNLTLLAVFGIFCASLWAGCKTDSTELKPIEDLINGNNQSSEESIEARIGSRLIAHVYESNDNGLSTYLKFEGSEGSHGLFGSIVLSNNANSCKYVYSYSIRENEINAVFVGSDCGAPSSNQKFTYREDLNTITCHIEGQLFTFFSIFNGSGSTEMPLPNENQSATYTEVTIGNQTWMGENLNTDRFLNGEPIPEAETLEEWVEAGKNKRPVWCYYNNDSANGAKYGKLYNWYAVNAPQGLAPEGWHVPSSFEWKQLIEFLGGSDAAGMKMKSASGWERWERGGHSTNESGFTGLAGGYRNVFGEFKEIGNYGSWWTSTSFSVTHAFSCSLNNPRYGEDKAGSHSVLKQIGYSVRCLRNVSPMPEGETEAFAEAKIGAQVWMGKNLNVDRFRNGDLIPEAKTVEDWVKAGKDKRPAWCYDTAYRDDPKAGEKYGKFYNWYAVNDPRGLAQQGWHVPSDAEWKQLIDFLGGADVAGGKMKSTSGWERGGNGTNESGFNALPGGLPYDISGWFYFVSEKGYWWSSSEQNINNAWGCVLYDDLGFSGKVQEVHANLASRGTSDKSSGRYVRCIKD